MISSIFGKTKPINFVFVIAYLFIFFLISLFFYSDEEITLVYFLPKLLAFGILVFSVFLIDFIAKKNSLSQNNSYIILVFALTLSLFPQIFLDVESIFANCLILLAVRKCISLKSQVGIKRKIFDATFWIGVATLFFNWSALVLILVYIAIVVYAFKDVKNWLIPLVALLAIAILIFTYLFMYDNLSLFEEMLSFDILFSLLDNKDIKYLLPFIFIMIIGFISLVAFISKLAAKTSKTQASLLMVTALLFIGISIVLLSGNRNGGEFIFIAFPLAVVITNYLEIISRDWLKNTIIGVFLLLPLLLLVL
ncbi:hypothetical protein GWK08_07275 [Leptobacterium flavescens]|uniref:Beta-carotene 15,15'-monooxygenase n=1 Tax=Leptobacterium flavescens TaxID=472055 RepID=A0A6P0UIU8_9FLAO|nr:DUF6427 family protein [Leptobacterium flavescens]NER13235.1 hypothetical protein [Leptobacterium flavescens]